jgi:transposase
LPESNDTFSEKRRAAIKNIRFNNQKGLVPKTMTYRLEFLERQREPLDMEIKKIARDSEDVKLLMTIPCLDYYLASLLSSYIGDVNRFLNGDRLASFFGVIPETMDSSST